MSGEITFLHDHEHKHQRLKELEDETRDTFEKVIEQYKLSSTDVYWLEFELKLCLGVIVEFEDAHPDDFEDLSILTFDSEPIHEIVVESGISETFLHASFICQTNLDFQCLRLTKKEMLLVIGLSINFDINKL